jgi:outer membrane protein
MKQTIIFQVFLFLGFAATAQAPLSLKQCIETGFANNLLVNQAGFQTEAAAINNNQSKGNMIPQVSGNITHYLNQGRSINPANNGYINSQLTTANYSLGSNVTLFNGFRLLNALKQTEYSLQASKMDLQQAKDKLTLDIILAYLQLLTNKDLLLQANRQLEVSRQQVDRLDIMNNTGAIKPSDLYDMKGQVASDQVTVTNAQNALDIARVSLAQLMNTPYDKNLELEPIGADQFDTHYGSSADSIYNIALQQLAIVKSADYKTKANLKALQAAKGNLLPSLGLGAGINTNYSSLATDALNNKISYGSQFRNNYGTYAGASINIPILNNFRYRYQVALAKIDVKNSRAQESTTKIQLKQNVEKDYLNMQAALDRYNSVVEQVVAYTESFRAAEIRFNQGVTSSVEYLLAKNKLDQARSNLIINRYEYLLRIKILDYYQAKPLW